MHPKVTDAIAQKIRFAYLRNLKKSTEYSEGKADGIRDTLNFLGIEIDKINGGESE